MCPPIDQNGDKEPELEDRFKIMGQAGPVGSRINKDRYDESESFLLRTLLYYIFINFIL